MIIPWDKDNAFHALDHSAFEGTQENVLVSRALMDPQLREVYVDALRTAGRLSRELVAVEPPPRPIAGVRDEALGWLEALVESSARLIRKAARADSVKPFTNDDFESGVADARRFARLRPSIVEAQIEASTSGRR